MLHVTTIQPRIRDIDIRRINTCPIRFQMNGLDAFVQIAILLPAHERMPARPVVLKPGRRPDLPSIAA